MKITHVLKNSFRVMFRYKLRSFFMIIGIVIGITAIIVAIALGSGVQEQMMGKISKIFKSSNIFVSAGGGAGESHRSSEEVTTLTIEDLKFIQQELENVEAINPMQIIMSQEIKYKNKNRSTRILGYAASSETISDRSVDSGEYFDENDIKELNRVALIGRSVVKELFDDVDPLGETIRIGNVSFRVIGVLESIGIGPHGEDKDDEIVIPITTMMKRVMNVDHIMAGILQLKNTKKTEETVDEIKKILRIRHKLSQNSSDDFSIMTPIFVQQMVDKANRVFNFFVPLVAAIILLVACFVISNLMLISVSERVSEIGLRKAVGARSRDILFQFLTEASIHAIFGSLLGFILSLIVLYLIEVTLNQVYVVSLPVIIMAIIISAFIGIISGLIPARRASAVDPIHALK